MESHPLSGQVAVVTGASRGIGRAVALHLARGGAAVAAIARSSAALVELRDEARQDGLRLMSAPADVSAPDEIEAAFAAVDAEFAAPSLVVACAGTVDALGPVSEADPQRWWNAVAVDLRGAMLTARCAARRMRPRGRGRIVTVYGNLGDRQRGDVSAFAVAKAGLARLTEALAVELDGTGVGAFCIHPGLVRTPLTERLAYSESTHLPDFGRDVEQRWADAGPAAALVEAIAAGAADSLTGRVLHVGDDLAELAERCHADPDLRRLRLKVP